jgi:hypothetical protein
VALGIKDSPQIFEDDTLRSAAGMGAAGPPPYTPPLAHVLTFDSGPAVRACAARSARIALQRLMQRAYIRCASCAQVDWLQQRFKLDLSKVSRLGGHSQPRTHRGKERFPGFAITCVCARAASVA